MKEKTKKDSEARPENTCDNADDEKEDDEQDRHIPEFTRKELMIATDSLKKRKINGQQEESKQKISKELTKKQIQ